MTCFATEMTTKRKMIYSILLVMALLLGWQGYEFWVAVGRQPRGERLER